MASLESIVKLYSREQKNDHTIPNLRQEEAFYKSLSSLIEVIELAGLAKNSKRKRHNHQRRLKRESLENFKNRLLLQKNSFLEASSFDEIIAIVEKCRVDGIGQLAIYDCALRISFYLDKEPQKVYLHSGTLKGAIRLNLNVKNRHYLEISELPSILQSLPAKNIEDILCIHKYDF